MSAIYGREHLLEQLPNLSTREISFVFPFEQQNPYFSELLVRHNIKKGDHVRWVDDISVQRHDGKEGEFYHQIYVNEGIMIKVDSKGNVVNPVRPEDLEIALQHLNALNRRIISGDPLAKPENIARMNTTISTLSGLIRAIDKKAQALKLTEGLDKSAGGAASHGGAMLPDNPSCTKPSSIMVN